MKEGEKPKCHQRECNNKTGEEIVECYLKPGRDSENCFDYFEARLGGNFSNKSPVSGRGRTDVDVAPGATRSTNSNWRG